MQYGAIMGIYWIVDFCLFPIGLQVPLLQLPFVILTLATPIAGYQCVRHFRNHHWPERFSFKHVFFFSFQMFFYGALLAAVAHFIYFQYIDQGMIYNYYMKSVETVEQMQGTEELVKTLKETLALVNEMRPIELAMQILVQTLFYGLIFSVLYGFILKRNRVVPPPMPTDENAGEEANQVTNE
jgi:hypothetical protein